MVIGGEILNGYKNSVFCILVFLNLKICLAESLDSEEQQQAESPWILVPTFSSDPKLGTSLGGLAGYLFKIDETSEQSIVATSISYSDNDSYIGGLFGQLFFDRNNQKLTLGIGSGKIRNNYDDFLGSGISAQTTDQFQGEFLRYTYQIVDSWYLGGQFISSNYTIGASNILENDFDQIGIIGFDSNGVGLVVEYDTRDNSRNATTGSQFEFHNIGYRESLGGEESFDAYHLKYSDYTSHSDGNVFAWQAKGRWTNEAPIAGYSSIELRGYVRGNYLAPNYTHIDFEERIKLEGRWGLTVFAGVACLYDDTSDCGDSENLYPSFGAGVTYTLKKEAGIVIRAEVAKGESDEYVGYLKIGNSF